MSQVSVVLATFDRLSLLVRVFSALGAQTERGFRVVVVDDGSSDGTWAWLKSEAATVAGVEVVALYQVNRGQGRARNRALAEVDDGLVVFIDDDIVPGPDFLSQHLAAHARLDGKVAVLGFTDWQRDEIRVTPLLEMINREGHQFGYGHMTPGKEVPFTCFYTSNLSLRRGLLGNRPFAPEFTSYGWEDVELGYRLTQEGLRIIYHPQASAGHLHRLDLASFFERQKMVGRGIHTLWTEHPELRGNPHLAPVEPPGWFPLGRLVLPPLLPLLSRLDRLGIPLRRGFLHRVLMCGYYMGQVEGAGTLTPPG